MNDINDLEYDNLSEEDLYRLEKERRSKKRKAREAKRRRRRVKKILNRIFVATVIVLVAVGIMFGIKMIVSRNNSVTTTDDDADNQIVRQSETEEQYVKSEKHPDISSKYVKITENVDAKYSVLIDSDNYEILAGNGANSRIYPASMTKLMTLIVAVENIKDINMTYTMSPMQIDPLVEQGLARGGYFPWESYSAEDYLYGLILNSGADSAVALACMVAGSEEKFVEMMNEKCKDLGLANTHFTNSIGVQDTQNYSTPVELAMILKYAMNNELCRKILATQTYTTAPTNHYPSGLNFYNKTYDKLYNAAISGVNVIGCKSGYTDESGCCLATYAVVNGKKYICITAKGSTEITAATDAYTIYSKYLPK